MFVIMFKLSITLSIKNRKLNYLALILFLNNTVFLSYTMKAVAKLQINNLLRFSEDRITSLELVNSSM